MMNEIACKLRFYAALGLWLGVFVAASLGGSPAQASSKAFEWLAYYKGGSDASFDRVAAFIDNNPDWPVQRALQREAEDKLRGASPSAKYISWFQKHPPITYGAAILYIQSLQQAGRESEAVQAARNWWPEAPLSREKQKEFYNRYGGWLQKSDHLKRFDDLLYKGQSGNARGMAAVLGGGYPALAEARIALHNNSGNVDGLVAAVPASLQNDVGLRYERLHWRRERGYNAGAIELLRSAPKAEEMHDPGDWWRQRHIIVRRLMEERQYKQAYALASQHRQKEEFPYLQAEWVSGFLAFTFLKEYWKAFEHFERLYHAAETPISKARGAYWAGRASDALKRPDVAQKWYAAAARYDVSFYGQLAKERLGNKNGFRAVNAAAPSTSARSAYNSKEMAVAAKALLRAGKKEEAKMFIIAMREKAKSGQELILNAALASDMGLTNQSIKSAQEALAQFNVLNTTYTYPLIVRDVQGIRDVEWALLHGLIRQESRFDKTAISHAGARGLMQVMPATARGAARKMGLSHQTDWLTSRPAHNIQIGSRYIKEMVERYDGNYAIAAAAYNAGPGRADRWLKEFGDPRKAEIDLITWIELLPIYETRNYVQRVLEGVYVYRGLLEGTQAPPSQPIHVALN